MVKAFITFFASLTQNQKLQSQFHRHIPPSRSVKYKIAMQH